MRYRRLGATGLSVSEIGFGTWGIGGSANGSVAYGPTNDLDSIQALQRAYEMGVTFYDTADFYGFGHSEQLLGKALKDVRQKIIIASKVGILDAKGAQDFSPAHILSSIDASLQRLQTDYLDLYQLHSPPLELLEQNPEIIVVMQSLQTQGKVRAIGISVRSPDDGIRAVRDFGFKAVQVNFNLIDQRAAENGLLSLCAQMDAGVIIRTPLCFGFLTGKYSENDQYDPFDHRRKWSFQQVEKWAQAYRLFYPAVAQKQGQTDAQIALRYCLSYSAVSTAIPGMLTTDHVEENTAASEQGPLGSVELQKIGDIYKQNTFFAGK